jgi:hypothetical protein
MVTCNLKGGLGNMMFEIAATEEIAFRGGFETVYPNVGDCFVDLITQSTHSHNAFDYLNIFKNFDWYKNQDKPYEITQCKTIPHCFVPIRPEDNTMYDGYFQSEKYFDRERTLKLFEFDSGRPLKYINGDFCSIHVRRGDYISRFESTYEIPSMEYYKEAMYKIPPCHAYLVFSDDLKWCRENFKGGKFTFIDGIDYVCLHLMSQCKYNICANSSFSWWGAYLNTNPDKVVTFPAKWYKPTSRYNAMDIYPKNCIIL